jgi:predicted enzyme related to lactoylglutathione lyase
VKDGAGDGWAGLHDARGTGPRLLFLRVPEPRSVKNRVHLDINVVDREAEAERLIALGAQRLRTMTEGQGWIVMADPEGNEFCIT